MTDIREKVARAILETDPTCDYDGCKKRVESGVLGPSDRDWWENTLHAQADNALLACGYAEMRKALINLRQRTMSDGTPCFCGVETLGPMTMEHYNWCREARSILDRTGEK